jgi:hypothetical protein
VSNEFSQSFPDERPLEPRRLRELSLPTRRNGGNDFPSRTPPGVAPGVPALAAGAALSGLANCLRRGDIYERGEGLTGGLVTRQNQFATLPTQCGRVRVCGAVKRAAVDPHDGAATAASMPKRRGVVQGGTGTSPLYILPGFRWPRSPACAYSGMVPVPPGTALPDRRGDLLALRVGEDTGQRAGYRAHASGAAWLHRLIPPSGSSKPRTTG